MRTRLGMQEFLVGIAHLERFFRLKLHPSVRDAYFESVRDATREQWDKVVTYAQMVHKKGGLPRPADLRQWMGLPEPLSPAEEDGRSGAHIHGLTVSDFIERVRRGIDLPVAEPYKNEIERLVYEDQPAKQPPPAILTPKDVLAYIRLYADGAAEKLAQIEAFKRSEPCAPTTDSA